jgi:hypothetical protein
MIFFTSFMIFWTCTLTAQLAATKKVLSEEKASRSTADRSLAARQTTEQSLQTSDEARADLPWDLESV